MSGAPIVQDEGGHLRALVGALGDTLDPSILIGGWATWMRIQDDSYYSYDIDLIINSQSLRGTLRETLDDYSESHHHNGTKVRGTIDGVHIDAYIPYESQLGDNLRLKVDVLAQHADSDAFEGWSLLNIEAHVISKMAALIDRSTSAKGEKDAREILAFLFPDPGRSFSAPDPEYAVRIIFDATAGDIEMIPTHVETIFKLLPETLRKEDLGKRRRAELAAVGKMWINAAHDELARRRRAEASGAYPKPATQFRAAAGESTR